MNRSLDQVCPVVRQSYAKGLAEFSGTVGQFMVLTGGFAPQFHEFDSLARLDSAKKNGSRGSRRFRDDIQKWIHMALIDIGATGRPKHGGVSFPEPPAGVASRILRPGIGFSFNNCSRDSA